MFDWNKYFSRYRRLFSNSSLPHLWMCESNHVHCTYTVQSVHIWYPAFFTSVSESLAELHHGKASEPTNFAGGITVLGYIMARLMLRWRTVNGAHTGDRTEKKKRCRVKLYELLVRHIVNFYVCWVKGVDPWKGQDLVLQGYRGTGKVRGEF